MYFLKIIRIGILHHDSETPTILNNPINKSGLIYLIILCQRTVGIKESVIRCEQDMCCSEVIADDLGKILQFLNSIITSREHHRICRMACFIDGIVVDVNNIHALNHSTAIRSLRAYQIIIFNGNAVSVCILQYLVTVCGISRYAVSHNLQHLTVKLHFQFLMRKQCSHTKLRDRREDTLNILKLYVCLCLTP